MTAKRISPQPVWAATVVVGAEPHMPSLHPAPGSHFLSHEPHALGSFFVSTQAVLHMVGTYEKHWHPPSTTRANFTQAASPMFASPLSITPVPPAPAVPPPLLPAVPALCALPAAPPVDDPVVAVGVAGVVSSLLHAATTPSSAVVIAIR